MPKQATWTRDGRVILADGKPALYLDLHKDECGRSAVAPYQADNLAMQLRNALERGVIQCPANVGEYDALAQLPAASGNLAAALFVFVRALDEATPHDLRQAYNAARTSEQDYSLPAFQRRAHVAFADLLREFLK